MENEFDFFNNLNFGTDFTKQGLGGYGTYTDLYNKPVDTGDPNPVFLLDHKLNPGDPLLEQAYLNKLLPLASTIRLYIYSKCT